MDLDDEAELVRDVENHLDLPDEVQLKDVWMTVNCLEPVKWTGRICWKLVAPRLRVG